MCGAETTEEQTEKQGTEEQDRAASREAVTRRTDPRKKKTSTVDGLGKCTTRESSSRLTTSVSKSAHEQ